MNGKRNGKSVKPPMPPIHVPAHLCFRDVYHSLITTRETAALDRMFELPVREPKKGHADAT